MVRQKLRIRQLLVALDKDCKNENDSQTDYNTHLSDDSSVGDSEVSVNQTLSLKQQPEQATKPSPKDFITLLGEQKSKARGFGQSTESHIFEGILRMLAKYGCDSGLAIGFKRRHMHHVRSELPLLRSLRPDLKFTLKTRLGNGSPVLSISLKEVV